jgi:orotidine-5'-phosphate decarboxylase
MNDIVGKFTNPCFQSILTILTALMSKKGGFMGFRKRLAERQQEVNSLVCVGLDPLLEKIPRKIYNEFSTLPDWVKIAFWMIQMVDATAPLASLFKPQRAHWESIDDQGGGEKALRAVIRHIKLEHPTIPVFLDCKRGDISRTQERYRITHHDNDGVHGANFSPYMGKDTMSAFIDPTDKGWGVVGLGYTSNKSAREVQDVKIEDGRQYWEFIVEKILTWAKELGVLDDAGIVMAAAHEYPKDSGKVFSWHLEQARRIVRQLLWFLIPGIGTQGGFVEQTVKAAFGGPGTIAINSSSGIIFASMEDDYAIQAAGKTEELRDQIRAAGGSIQ